MRRTVLAIGSALALTLAGLSAPAIAAPHGHIGGPGFGRFGGVRGPAFGGPRFGFRGGFRGPRFGFGFGAPFFAYGSCSTVHRVWTPFGWRWRRIWVC
jgi:hypothetical protein